MRISCVYFGGIVFCGALCSSWSMERYFYHPRMVVCNQGYRDDLVSETFRNVMKSILWKKASHDDGRHIPNPSGCVSRMVNNNKILMSFIF
jgi:hypothetical protein